MTLESSGAMEPILSSIERQNKEIGISTHYCCTIFGCEFKTCVETDTAEELFRSKCRICVDLDRNLYPESHVGSYSSQEPSDRYITTALQNISNSAARGCRACSILWAGVKKFARAYPGGEEGFIALIGSTIVEIKLREEGLCMLSYIAILEPIGSLMAMDHWSFTPLKVYCLFPKTRSTKSIDRL
jgi:hypothetical protein